MDDWPNWAWIFVGGGSYATGQILYHVIIGLLYDRKIKAHVRLIETERPSPDRG